MEKLEKIKEHANHCLNCPTKPCTKACPLGNNIPDFIECIKKEKYEEAYDILSKTTVLQPICGRICPHEKQCQGKCVRGIKGTPVQIGELEAFVGDVAIKEDYDIKKDVGIVDRFKKIGVKSDEILDVKNCNKKIAVVGSGPAGLTCAAFLAKKGYIVTIYEKHDKLGGLLRYGIPEFRLDRSILDSQIQKILRLGIEVIYNKELGVDYSLEDLCKKFDAVFLSFGANISKKMNIPGEHFKGVFGGNELLESGVHPDYRGKKVAVIGGGNVAMDVSRTVKYLGADRVYVIYRRAEEQMPAERKEVADAKEEGVEFLFQNNIVKINGGTGLHEIHIEKPSKKIRASDSKGYVNSVECVKTELVKNEETDRLVPVNIEGSNYILDIDYVIMAVGSEAENNVVEKLGVELDKFGYIKVDEGYKTSMENVFAGGDLVGTKSTVAWAARNGRDAAEHIEKFLKILE